MTFSVYVHMFWVLYSFAQSIDCVAHSIIHRSGHNVQIVSQPVN